MLLVSACGDSGTGAAGSGGVVGSTGGGSPGEMPAPGTGAVGGGAMTGGATATDTGGGGGTSSTGVGVADAAVPGDGGGALAGDAGPAGACDNAPDSALIESGAVDRESDRCGRMCILNGPDCTVMCMIMAIDVSAECARCFADIVQCSATSCALACFADSAGMQCRTCVDTMCGPAFNACSGRM